MAEQNGDKEETTSELEGPERVPTWFDPDKGNFLQFLGIVFFTLGGPLILFQNINTFGFILCPIGLALYGVGRFSNWYFWYRLQ